ncbi:MAG: L-fuconolactonase [Gaiellales bacterium]|nr:L-fuconolactonase [Gaiellales bacterium]
MRADSRARADTRVIVDAHHHFLDPTRFAYPWIGAREGALARVFGPGDLAPLLASAGVSSSVLVQTLHDPEETRSMLAAAAVYPWIAGVVGWVDLQRDDVADQIARVRALPGGDRLAGIRHLVHDEPDPDWLLRPAVLRSLEVVGREGLAVDLLLRSRELPAAIACARELGGVRLVVDHLAKPVVRLGPAAPVNAAWLADLRAMAELPHVVCKLSGLVTEAEWKGWTVDELRPFAEHALSCFGPDRVLFGSDWPVCTLAAPYQEVIDAAHALIADCSPREREAMLATNARDLYGLNLDGRERMP